MAQFTALSDAALAEIARVFDLGELRSWVALEEGTVNSNFALTTAQGRFFVRVNEGKTEADVSYEARLVEALADRGVPTPRPLRAGARGYAIIDSHFISAFPWIPGRHLGRAEVGVVAAAEVGGLLARLHLAAAALGPEFHRLGIYRFADISARCEGLRGHPDPVLAEPLRLLAEEQAALQARDAERRALPGGVIHGDIFRDNVLFVGERLSAVIDFEQAASGTFAYDLAVALNAWCFDESFAPALMSAMVGGYEQVRPLLAAERAGLVLEGRAAAWRFAVTRITDVYLRGRHSPEKDFGRYLRRLLRWRQGFPELASESPSV